MKELEILIDRVLKMNHTETEWLALEKEVNDCLESLTGEQQEAFAESGAGEVLYMSCSGIRFEKGEVTP